jgi:voltage-gated potassium channel
VINRSQRRRLLAQVEEHAELPMVALSFVWLILFVTELVMGLTASLQLFGSMIWAVFVVDFALRLALTEDRSGYLRRNWLTGISLIVPALRMFRALRSLAFLRGVRGVRAVRVVGSFNRAVRAIGRTFRKRGLGYVLAATLVLVLLGAAAVLAFESGRPGFADYAETLWWTAMMVLSVGSDVWPQSPEGRMLALVLAGYGLTVFGYVAATLTSFFLETEGSIESELLEEVRALRRQVDQLNDAPGTGSGD